MTSSALRILALTGSLILFASSASAQEQVGGGWLPISIFAPKIIPIYRFGDTVYVASTFDGDASLSLRRPAGSWYRYTYDQSDHYPGFVEYFVSRTRSTYLYNSITGKLHFRTSFFTSRDCPGRPVVDRQNNIHIIWPGEANQIYYAYSTDTLATFDDVDTVYSQPEFLRIVRSPNDSLLCALFINTDTDILYKYYATEGQPFNLAIPDEMTSCDAIIYNAFDIVLDDSGSVYYVGQANLEYGWTYFFVWSERFGYRPFTDYIDYVPDGTNFEIAFGPNPGEMLLTMASLPDIGNPPRFFATSDSGDTWIESSYSASLPMGYYGSTTRTYSDVVDYVYFVTDPSNLTRYLAIPRDSIFENLVNVDDNITLPSPLELTSYPNPFNGRTFISFSGPTRSVAVLEIFDIGGRRISTLFNGQIDSEGNGVEWNARNPDGNSLPSGLYIARLTIGDSQMSRKLLFLK